MTSAAGFKAGAIAAGIKKRMGEFDLVLLTSSQLANAAAVFTCNRFRAAPLLVSETHIGSGQAQAIIVNAGCANAGTGKDGYIDSQLMTQLAADKLRIDPARVLVASTGVIGVRLPMEKIKAGIENMNFSDDGGHDFARGIMTTDLVAKEIAVNVPEYGFTIGGCAKGSGMIHPDMATMLAFITTDAIMDSRLLKTTLKRAVDLSFNVISVDGDTSTNDSVFILANGASGSEIKKGTNAYLAFTRALKYVCVHLAKSIARDGEGATKLIELVVSGAASKLDARKVARTILSSPLVKTAVYGGDPNWGRILAAAGRSGSRFDPACVNLSIGNVEILKNGTLISFDKKTSAAQLQGKDIFIHLDLGLGQASVTGWGCDMSAEYIRINADYTT
ncbi:glutamate N-acetyltransferase/N-acetylglutamate synthase [Dehalogenimonas sp. WBC-2]|nr:glutamate N-acetyltransferase/N-acetylglutamate synthase [Dehalogenimonas sp. WBC-2]